MQRAVKAKENGDYVSLLGLTSAVGKAYIESAIAGTTPVTTQQWKDLLASLTKNAIIPTAEQIAGAGDLIYHDTLINRTTLIGYLGGELYNIY